MVPIRAWSTSTPSIRLEDTALSIKACSRRALSFCGDCFVNNSCFPSDWPKSARYQEVAPGTLLSGSSNCRKVITTHALCVDPKVKMRQSASEQRSYNGEEPSPSALRL